MKSLPNPSLRGMTTDLLKNLEAQESLRATSLKASKKKSIPIPFQAPAERKSASDVNSLHKLAVLYHSQKQYEQAERLYQEVLTLCWMEHGPMDASVGQCLNNVGRLYLEEGWYSEAEVLLERSLAIVRENLGNEHAKVARRLTNLAELYFATNRIDEGLDYYRQAIRIDLKELGASAEATLRTMRAYVKRLRKMDRIAEAESLEKSFHKPREKERRSDRPRRLNLSSSHEPARPYERRRRPDRRKSPARRQK